MLNAEQILAEAEEQVGISDSDQFVRENLQRLVQSLNSESGMSEQGFEWARQMLVRDMISRLQGLKWVRDYPEILDESIDQPIFLMGLPRSGTTYFQYLFDLDYRFRQIRTWEALSPFPPAGADPESAQQRRAEWAQRRREMMPEVADFDAMHLHDEDGSEECHAFMEQTLGAAGLNNLYRVPSYFDYLLDEADRQASYHVHKRQLQLLQWRQPKKRWSLKYPNHLLSIPEILEVYPDARLVMTHRDPVQTLASISKLTSNLREARCEGEIDRHQVGRDMTHFVQRHIDKIMEVVTGPLADKIIHVDYYALVDDPQVAMFEVHEQLGIDSPEDVRRAVKEWHRANPKNARGVNAYGFEEYGLDENALAEQFSEYMKYFDIPRERDGLRD